MRRTQKVHCRERVRPNTRKIHKLHTQVGIAGVLTHLYTQTAAENLLMCGLLCCRCVHAYPPTCGHTCSAAQTDAAGWQGSALEGAPPTLPCSCWPHHYQSAGCPNENCRSMESTDSRDACRTRVLCCHDDAALTWALESLTFSPLIFRCASCSTCWFLCASDAARLSRLPACMHGVQHGG
jgi:hypothetical protein